MTWNAVLILLIIVFFFSCKNLVTATHLLISLILLILDEHCMGRLFSGYYLFVFFPKRTCYIWPLNILLFSQKD